jgi:hypothetical protein
MPSPPPVFYSVPPDYHPEFGYLSPGPQRRRILRTAAIAAAFGAAAGALTLLAVMPRGAAEPAAVKNAAAAAAAVTGGTAAVARLAPAAATQGLATARPDAAGKPCADETWPYRAADCGAATQAKSADLRVLRPEEPAQSAPAQVLPEPAASAIAADAKAVETKAPPPKKARRHVRRPRAPAEPDARSAYASPYGARYAQPRREWGGGWDW